MLFCYCEVIDGDKSLHDITTVSFIHPMSVWDTGDFDGTVNWIYLVAWSWNSQNPVFIVMKLLNLGCPNVADTGKLFLYYKL